MSSTAEDCYHLGVKTLLRSRDGKVLLLEREHRKNGLYWDIPGGRVQRGESLIETLRRELEEETGFTQVEGARPLTMLVTKVRISTQEKDVGLIVSIFCHNIDAVFTPRLSAEHTNFGWFTLDQAAELLKHSYPAEFITILSALHDSF